MKKNYILKNLECANCGGKIEKAVGEVVGVKTSVLNFMAKRLSVEFDDALENTIDISVEKIVKKFESDVQVEIESKIKEIKNKKISLLEQDKFKYFLFGCRIALAIIIILVNVFVDYNKTAKLIAYIFAYIAVGYEVLWTAAKNLIKGKVFNENILMTIASIGAFIIGEYEEAVAVLVFYGIGELLQELAVIRTRGNIAKLMDIRPDYAMVLRNDSLIKVAPEEVELNEIISVNPGEKVPLDGVVLKGESFIDTKALTGESVPKKIKEGEQILSGSICNDGQLQIQVAKKFEESTVSKILKLVEDSGSKKAKSDKFITKFARYYTPAVVFIAIAVAIIPPLAQLGSFKDWVYNALSFLIISCPCALVISIPISFFGGIGGGARHGVLIKGGNYLEALQKADTIVFDKTGTLTYGVFEVSDVQTQVGVSKDEVLKYAAIAEQYSSHPIGKSILKSYPLNEHIEVEVTELAGLGIVVNTVNNIILVGNAKLMEQYNISYTKTDIPFTNVYVAVDDKYLGNIAISDKVKENAKQTVKKLKDLGIKRVVMLSGDNKKIAGDVAQKLGIDEYFAELLPGDKVDKIENILDNNGKSKVIFVGDGINDAPVLARADIGIAMGGIGSDSAIESADIVIMNDDLDKIVTGKKIAKKTRSIVLQNIIFSLGVKALIMILALLNITSIWFAIFADVGVALIALLNAMRAMAKIKE